MLSDKRNIARKYNEEAEKILDRCESLLRTLMLRWLYEDETKEIKDILIEIWTLKALADKRRQYKKNTRERNDAGITAT